MFPHFFFVETATCVPVTSPAPLVLGIDSTIGHYGSSFSCMECLSVQFFSFPFPIFTLNVQMELGNQTRPNECGVIWCQCSCDSRSQCPREYKGVWSRCSFEC